MPKKDNEKPEIEKSSNEKPKKRRINIYQRKPVEFSLAYFLDKQINEQVHKEEEEFLEKNMIKERREFRESATPNPYAPIRRSKLKPIKAYLVTYRDFPDLFFIGFGETMRKVGYQAAKYFHHNFHPAFMGTNRSTIVFHKDRFKRLPDFDIYAEKGRIPIPELMKFGISFPCSCCGKDNFNYSDYEAKRCFIFEGEENVLPYADGFILCYDCYKKLEK